MRISAIVTFSGITINEISRSQQVEKTEKVIKELKLAVNIAM